MSLAQTSLAITVLGSTVATYYACSPPNPSPQPDPKSTTSSSDVIRRVGLTSKHGGMIAMSPVGLLALHTAGLAYSYGNSQSLSSIPSPLLGNGADNGLQVDLITWSRATAIPLTLIFGVGLPLRFIPYSTLGKNFTFALAPPDALNTSGIYRYLQHPSYTGLVVLILSNAALLYRIDGAASCWIPTWLYPTISFLARPAAILSVALLFSGVVTRVKQEERMLREKFGVEWEEWHNKTPRFLPWKLL